MLFKLSIKNIRKSFKDYAIYFFTLVLGVAIFYIFSSLDTQTAILNLSKSSYRIIELMMQLINGISVFIAGVLACLILYANNFLIKRRNKEFGVYLTLGMSKFSLSNILLIETLLVGLCSLVAGLALGVFGSQFMSSVVASLFEADMSKFTFIFSKAAFIKTIVFFSVTYIGVIIFNIISISRCSLIKLLNAGKRSEKIKMKNPIISVVIFIISVCLLGFAYYKISGNINTIDEDMVSIYILMGVVGTFLFFYSLAGFILKLVQSTKGVYYKNLNCFVLRQINSKINTTVISMSIICLMLFVTICMLSAGISLNSSFSSQLRELNPVDVCLEKAMTLDSPTRVHPLQNLSDIKKANEYNKLTAKDTLEESGYDVDANLKDMVDVYTYQSDNLTLRKSLGTYAESAKTTYAKFSLDNKESIMGVNEYNRLAKSLKNKTYTLKDNEYIIVCDYIQMEKVRNEGLKRNTKININGKEYSPQYNKCKYGFLYNGVQHFNTGIILIPDKDVKTLGLNKERSILTANYKVTSEKEKRKTEDILNSKVASNKNIKSEIISMNGYCKLSNYDSSRGLSAIVIFIGTYIGIIFLITSSAILALKELSESSDNKERYNMIRKIGASEKQINSALFKQIGIFFLMPLSLAIVHSAFGITFSIHVLETLGKQDMLIPIIKTGGIIILVYGGYFILTYLQSKKIIRGNR